MAQCLQQTRFQAFQYQGSQKYSRIETYFQEQVKQTKPLIKLFLVSFEIDIIIDNCYSPIGPLYVHHGKNQTQNLEFQTQCY